MRALPIHPRTGALALGFRRDGRAIWPILGADDGGARPTSSNPMLDRLYTERQTHVDFVDQTLAGALDSDGQPRDLSNSERETLNRTKARIGELDAQITPLEEFEKLRLAGDHAGAGQPRSTPTGGGAGGSGGSDPTHLGARTQPRPHDYASRGHVIVDILRAAELGQSRSVQLAGGSIRVTDQEARAARDRLAAGGVSGYDMLDGPQSRIQNQTTTETPGLLPEPIIGQVIKDIDAARPFISSIGALDLGDVPGKVFSRPVVTQTTLVGAQTAEKTEVPSRQFVVGDIPFAKQTRGGALNVSRQDIDWTSPAAWNAILTDLQESYQIDTEELAADAFHASVVSAAIEVATDDLRGWFDAIYAGAAQAYAGVKRLPDHMWMSLDMWAHVGPVIDAIVRQNASSGASAGSSSPASFAGNLADIPRSVVPAFPADTLIVGVTNRVEFYEERIGFLQAVEPKLLGVEIAYGGYVATATLKPAGFAKISKPGV